jgi:hypothetical protein
MDSKIFLIFVFLLTVVVWSFGFDRDLYAQTGIGNGPASSTPEKKRSEPPAQKNSKLSKRNLMMLEQAESARLRAEKIMAGPQGNAETPKK